MSNLLHISDSPTSLSARTGMRCSINFLSFWKNEEEVRRDILSMFFFSSSLPLSPILLFSSSPPRKDQEVKLQQAIPTRWQFGESLHTSVADWLWRAWLRAVRCGVPHRCMVSTAEKKSWLICEKKEEERKKRTIQRTKTRNEKRTRKRRKKRDE